MEILYVTTMAAIFVLCLALLFTARRILRSSPLSSGELALSGIYETQMPGDAVEEPAEVSDAPTFKQTVRDRLDSVVSRAATQEQEHVESEPVMASWVASSLRTTVRMSEPAVNVLHEDQDEVDEMDKLNSFVSERIPLGTFHANTIEPEPVAAESKMADAPAEQPIHASLNSTMDSTAADSRENIAEQTPGKKKRARTRKPLPAGYGYALECLLLGVSVLVLVTTQRSSFRNRSLHSSRVA
jgi:hypothetical protein